MPAAKTFLAATQANNTAVFDAFKAHCNGSRLETKATIMKTLREQYPDHHVTETHERHTSLFQFASTGQASYTFDCEDESFNASRKWSAVGDGIEKQDHPGELKDRYQFARYVPIYVEEHNFILYYAQWEDPFQADSKVFYVLYPRAESCCIDGHCAETDALILAAGKWTSQLHGEIFVFDDGYWDKSKDLWKSVEGASWDDVILNPEMKKSLIEDVQTFFDNRAVYKQFSVPWKRGIIMHGQPGNGKTASTRAIMNSLYNRPEAIPSLYVKSLATRCNTEQHAIGQIFQQARASAPCLLVFEDLDSLVNDNVRSYFLNEVDGLESNDGIMMIGSTNHLSKLDPAIAKRPSRFDRKYNFKVPAEDERRLYAEYWRKKLTSNETVDFPEELTDIIAKLTEGFSFAYLKELFVTSLLSIVRGFKGDDFEFVDAEEAASADGEADKTAEADAKEEKDVCTCDSKCSTCNKPLPEKKSSEEMEGEKSSSEKTEKLVMPNIDIPAHLSENFFLKVMKYQIRTLIAEMDNTKEDS